MATGNETQITPPRVPIIDTRTNAVSREWYRWFYSLYNILGAGTGVIPVDSGGTGLGTIPTNGQLLIGNGTGYTLNTLGYGVGISVTNGAGTITVANTGVLSNLAGTGISVSGATGNVTIGNTGVLSIIAGTGISASSTAGNVTLSNTGVLSWSGGTTGLTPAAATTGAVTLAGTLVAVNGGTGLSSYAIGDLLYANSTTTLTKLTKPTANALLTMTSGGAPSWKIPRYGAFHDTTNQTAAANTPTAITYNSTDYSDNVSIGTPTSRIVVSTAGLYNIQFSIQFTNSSASVDDVVVWLRVNGTDVPNSASWGAVHGKHGGTNGQLIMALNLFYQFAASDYFQLIWMTVGGTTGLETIAASAGTPAYPAAPSVILTVSDNIAA